MLELLYRLKTYQSRLNPKIDKLGHFFWGFIYAVIGFVLDKIGLTNGLLIVLLPLLLSVVSEYVDYKTGLGNKEFLDVVYTIASGIIMYLII